MKGIVCGIGINDAEYNVKHCPFYARWKGVIHRAFSGNKKWERVYDGCSVDFRWLRFMPFREWMAEQPWHGNHLDKDILSPGVKVYSPDTSVFVPVWLNTLLYDGSCSSGTLPTGVSLNPRSKTKPYQARVHSGDGIRLCVGTFDTKEEAHIAWRSAKADVIENAIDRYKLTDRYDGRVCDALSMRASSLRTM